MPFYRVNGMTVHIKMSGKAPAQCVAPIDLDGKRVRCCGISAFLCDHEMDSGGTCDAPLCAEHATQVGRNRHLCPRHEAERRAAEPGLFDPAPAARA